MCRHPAALSRYCKNSKDQLATARDAFRKFDAERHAYDHLSSNNPWDVLALAQHFGLPTRLLDWSLPPTVALFFALDGVRYKKVKFAEMSKAQREEYHKDTPQDGEYFGLAEAHAAVYVIPANDDSSPAQLRDDCTALPSSLTLASSTAPDGFAHYGSLH